jgi:hypothetical protein
MAQDRYTVAFSKSAEEQKLLEWVKNKSIILGQSAFTKQMLYEVMLREEKEEAEKNN